MSGFLIWFFLILLFMIKFFRFLSFQLTISCKRVGGSFIKGIDFISKNFLIHGFRICDILIQNISIHNPMVVSCPTESERKAIKFSKIYK